MEQNYSSDEINQQLFSKLEEFRQKKWEFVSAARNYRHYYMIRKEYWGNDYIQSQIWIRRAWDTKEPYIALREELKELGEKIRERADVSKIAMTKDVEDALNFITNEKKEEN